MAYIEFNNNPVGRRVGDCAVRAISKALGMGWEAAQNTRDIIENANRNNQAILDKICSLEIDAKNDRIAELERQITAANFAASQLAQTAEIISKLPASTTA